MFNNARRVLAALLPLGIGLSAATLNAAVPNPPHTVCIDGQCTSDTTPAKTTGTAVKWHPGFYVWYAPGSVSGVPGHRVDQTAQRNQFLDFATSICSETAIKGVQLVGLWHTFEGDTAGDYTAGFAAIDAILAKLTACNKRLIVSVQTTWFGNYGGDTKNQLLPGYIVSGSQYGVTELSPGTGFTARTWQAATTDRLIALARAYGARYDKHPNFEMISLGETSMQVQSDGFSNETHLVQLKRLLTGARAAFPTTGLRVAANDMGGDANIVQLLAHCAPIYCAFGGPDVWPGDITQADRIFVGKNDKGADVYTDYRDQLPWSVNVDWQSFNLSGGNPRWSLQQLFDVPTIGYSPTNGDFRMPTMKVKYFVWYVNFANGNSANQWTTAELPFLRSKAPGHFTPLTCPTRYPGCNGS